MEEEFISKVIDAYNSMELEPVLIPRGTIRHLRGCLWCLDLDDVKEIDSVAISGQRRSKDSSSFPVYSFEYALRGNLRDIQEGRLMVQMISSFKGFLRRELTSVKWAVPKPGDLSSLNRFGKAPVPGEVYPEGPHEYLVELLNRDSKLNNILIRLVDDLGENTKFFVYTDLWGESIRFACNSWVSAERAVEVFLSKQYLKLSKGVLGHVSEVRNRFGGLTI